MSGTDEVTIVVVGGSGDLARRKIYPALFALYCQHYLPEHFHVLGFGRSSFTDVDFRTHITAQLTCRYAPGESCAQRMSEFLARCSYVTGRYDSRDSFLDLYEAMHAVENGHANRLFYLAVPPSVFVNVAASLAGSGLVNCGDDTPWSRAVIEKPFGKDRPSSDLLTERLAQVFSENQTYRIDHYLGKEVVQNLLVLRFANLIFEPIWNREFIRSVQISWTEDLDLQGRAGYFDDYGIIRDVMQNHLLQILALIAMERPAALTSHAIRDEKVRVLQRIPPVTLDRLVVGQYARSLSGTPPHPAYIEEPGVKAGSLTPTYAAAALSIDTPRWRGVPFLMRAGKGLNDRTTEIRVIFRDVPGNLFGAPDSRPLPNELRIRVQPDEGLFLHIVSKVPGLGMTLGPRPLDLLYKAAFAQEIPEAYESLLLDVLRGERSLFIRRDELAAAWDVVTPALHQLEEQHVVPEPYAFGGTGPDAADRLARGLGVSWTPVST